MGKAYTCKGNCGRSLGLIYLNISMKKNCESGSAEQSLETFRLPVCLKVTGDLKFSEVNVNMIEANKRT